MGALNSRANSSGEGTPPSCVDSLSLSLYIYIYIYFSTSDMKWVKASTALSEVILPTGRFHGSIAGIPSISYSWWAWVCLASSDDRGERI